MAEPSSSNSSSTTKTIENPCIKQAKRQLYKDRIDTGDVKFIVESKEIWAHRSVLAALSPKYKAQFYGSIRDTGDIKVDDVSAAAFEEFLQFFYEVTLTSGNIEGVFTLANQSLVESLLSACKTFLLATVEVRTLGTYILD